MLLGIVPQINLKLIEMFDIIYPQLVSYAKAIRNIITAIEPHTIQT